MNEIIVRTNRNDYACGSIIYGAVYVRIFKPVSADSLDISVSGREVCKWSKLVPSLGHSLLSNDSHDSNVTDDSNTNIENVMEDDISCKNISFIGERVLFLSEFSVVNYSDKNVPLGCFVYPFQFLLKQGLPSSFREANNHDNVKMSSYNAEIEYKIEAKFRGQPALANSNYLSVKNEDFVLTKTERCERQVRAKVSSCCCLPKGEVLVRVELDKIMYTLGETIMVKFWIENKSDVKIDHARIKLVRTVALLGKYENSEDEKLNTQEAFPFDVSNVLKELDSCQVRNKYYEVSVPLLCENEEILSSTLGKIVQCRYQLEVEVIIPWDVDVSVFIPIKVYPKPVRSWVEWKPPDWIKNVQVTDANPLCSVARHVLESSEFANVPLPLKGLAK